MSLDRQRARSWRVLEEMGTFFEDFVQMNAMIRTVSTCIRDSHYCLHPPSCISGNPLLVWGEGREGNRSQDPILPGTATESITWCRRASQTSRAESVRGFLRNWSQEIKKESGSE